MYLVDTSVWIHALRPSGSPAIRAALRPLILSDHVAITEWILLELMTGLLKSEHKETLLHRFAPVRRLDFNPAWWEETWDHAARLRKRGISATAADCLIATIALEHDVTLLHCDADFEAIKATLSLKTCDWTTHLRR
jgi:hypothetical protein